MIFIVFNGIIKKKIGWYYENIRKQSVFNHIVKKTEINYDTYKNTKDLLKQHKCDKMLSTFKAQKKSLSKCDYINLFRKGCRKDDSERRNNGKEKCKSSRTSSYYINGSSTFNTAISNEGG